MRLLLLALMIFLPACIDREVFIAFSDRFLFQHFGTTVFVNPSQLTMKEIHLDSASLRGKQVVISGKVVEVSDHFTYMVIGDDQARMLVVLTGLDSAGPTLRRAMPKSVRVLGVVENGQKGLPYLMARSVNVIENPDQT